MADSTNVLTNGALADGNDCHDDFARAIAVAIQAAPYEVIVPNDPANPQGSYWIEQDGGYAFEVIGTVPLPKSIKFKGAGSTAAKVMLKWSPPQGTPAQRDLTEGAGVPGFCRFGNCVQVAVEGLTFDLHPRIYTQGKIKGFIGDHKIRFEIDGGATGDFVPEFQSSDTILGFDAAGNLVGWNYPCVTDGTNPVTGAKIQIPAFDVYQEPGEIGTEFWTVDMSTASDPVSNVPPTKDNLWHGRVQPASRDATGATIPNPVIDKIVVIFRKRGAFMFSTKFTADLVLRDLVVHGSGYGLLGGIGIDDVTLEKVQMEATLGGRWTGGTAVNIHSCRGIFEGTDCYFEYLGDDVYNNNARTWIGAQSSVRPGLYDPVGVSLNRRIVTARFGNTVIGGNETPPPRMGDAIEIWPSKRLDGRFLNRVLNVSPNGLPNLWDIELQDELPVGFKAGPIDGWYIFNRSQVQKLRLKNWKSKACAGTCRIHTDDAIIDGHDVRQSYGPELTSFFPQSEFGNEEPNQIGYAGGLTVRNGIYISNGHGDIDTSGGSGIYLFLGDGVRIEPDGPLPGAKSTVFENVLQQDHPLGGIAIVGHSATILSLTQNDIGAARTTPLPSGAPYSIVQQSDLYSSAGAMRLLFLEGNGSPLVTTSLTGRRISPSTSSLSRPAESFLWYCQS